MGSVTIVQERRKTPDAHPIAVRADEALGMARAERVAQRDMTPAERSAHHAVGVGQQREPIERLLSVNAHVQAQ